MKKYLLILTFFFFTINTHSQVLISLLFGDKLNSDGLEFGLEGGFNYANITGLESNKMESNFFLGFYFDIRLKNQWSLDTGVMVKSTLGNAKLTEKDLEFLQVTTYDTDGTYTQKLGYFLVPALIKYKFDNHIYVEAGPQFGLMTKAWVEHNYEEDGNSGRIKQNNRDMMNRIDVGIMSGAGFRLLKGLGWTVGVKYYYGFVDVYKSKTGTKNNALFLKMNVPIGLSEKSKAEIKEQKDLKLEEKAEKKLKKKERKENNKIKNNDI